MSRTMNRSEYSAAVRGDGADERLFRLYCARVANAETVKTLRRDIRGIFRDSLAEAKVALEVFNNEKEEVTK